MTLPTAPRLMGPLAAALIALAATAAGATDKPAKAAVPAKSDVAAKSDGGRQCFWTRQADGFAAQGDRIVNVRVGARDVYQFEMMGHCPDIDWNQRIALV